MVRLQRIEGPACPTCGCQDARLLQSQTRWNKLCEQRQCRHCGRVWFVTVDKPEETEPGSKPLPAAIIYQRIRCPQCGSANTKITKTLRPVRHHKCLDCRHCFKSCED